jgi:hypothetical protein
MFCTFQVITVSFATLHLPDRPDANGPSLTGPPPAETPTRTTVLRAVAQVRTPRRALSAIACKYSDA